MSPRDVGEARIVEKATNELEIAAIQHPGDLTTMNDQRGSSSGRVWFLVSESDVEAPCLGVGVRVEVGALEWIDNERFVPANGVNHVLYGPPARQLDAAAC